MPQSHSLYHSGSGTTQDPYLICSIQQWQALSANSSDWSRSFKLGAHLSFSTFTAANFPFVGDSTTPFSGSLNGAGFTLSDASLTSSSAQILALFPRASGSPTIENLTISNFSLGSSNQVAALVGVQAAGGTLVIRNISVSGITLRYQSSSGNGGLVASSTGSVQIQNIAGSNIILDPTAGAWNTGGLVGNCSAQCTFTDVSLDAIRFRSPWPGFSFNRYGGLAGSVTGVTATGIRLTNLDLRGYDGAIFVGGLFGMIMASSPVAISDTAVQGSVTGTTSVGGLIGGGGSNSLSITRSKFIGNLPFNSVAITGTAGGLVGDWSTSNSAVSIETSFARVSLAQMGATASVGGLFGQISVTGTAQLSIADSYAQSTLTASTGTPSISGFGQASGATVNIQRSYAVSALTSTGTKGCTLLTTAGITTLTISDVWYDQSICTHGDTATGNHANVFGDTTTNMQPASAFPNWNNGFWVFSLNSYPRLTWE